MPALMLEDEDFKRVEELASVGRRALDLLDTLPTAQRDAVRARVFDEREYEEMAVELDCSEEVVRQRVSRGLRELKNLMEDNNG